MCICSNGVRRLGVYSDCFTSILNYLERKTYKVSNYDVDKKNSDLIMNTQEDLATRTQQEFNNEDGCLSRQLANHDKLTTAEGYTNTTGHDDDR